MSNARRVLPACAVVSLFCASMAFATQNSCPSTNDTIATRTLTGTGAPTYTNIAVPGNGTTSVSALTNANAGNGSGLGCTAVDLTFNNFAVANAAGSTNENTLPNALAESNAGATYLAQTTPDTLLFSTLQGDGSGGDGSATDGADNYKVNESESMTTATSYTVADAKSTGIWAVTLQINDITLGTSNGGDGSGTVSVYVCEGANSTFTGGTSTAPTGCSNGGTLVKDTGVALAQEATQSIAVSLTTLKPTAIDVMDVFTLTSAEGGTGTCTGAECDETGFLTWDNQFAESPEPSTFILLGTALAAIGLLRLRASRIRCNRVRIQPLA